MLLDQALAGDCWNFGFLAPARPSPSVGQSAASGKFVSASRCFLLFKAQQQGRGFKIHVNVKSSPSFFGIPYTLTRHRLGCFCTHHSLGGRIRPPPVLSRKRMDVERRTRRHSKDLDETLPNHFRKFKIEVTCQVTVRSKDKIGCFQVAGRSDLKRSIFRPKISICTPKDHAKVLTSEIFSYLA